MSQVRFSRRRRCRTQKCGQLDLSSTRACWLVICQVWLSRVARRQMRAVRVMRLGMRTYRISCMDVTDSICRRARMESQSVVKLCQWARVENAPKMSEANRLSGILDYQEFEDIEDGDFPPSSMFTGMKRWFVQELRQSDS